MVSASSSEEATVSLTAARSAVESRVAAPLAPRLRSPLAISLALLLVSTVGVTLFSFVTTEARLEHDYGSPKLETSTASNSQDGSASNSQDGSASDSFEYVHPPRDFDPKDPNDGDLSMDYECIGWRRTGGDSPDGPREPEYDANCTTKVRGGPTGYCLFQHKTTKEVRRALTMQSHALQESIHFTCDQAPLLTVYGARAVAYVHDKKFGFANNQNDLMRTAKKNHRVVPTMDAAFFERAVVMVIYEKLLFGAYVSVRSMREMGMKMPIEMWYRRDETDPQHPLLQLLVTNFGVFLRKIKDPLATRFYTKLHAVFYSAFDNILLLDADNFPVTDPTYLFETAEYRAKGAMFWPDYWSPRFTIFNLKRESLVWQVFDTPFVDMFEQESGQVLINRRHHMTALNVMMYYGFSLPRVHEELELVWGDKDLFRLAWMKTNSSFHFIARPPGAAGKLRTVNETSKFCGVTMVQYDPKDEIVFLHRNNEKLSETNKRVIWTHIQQYNVTPPTGDYWVHYAGSIVDDIKNCYGKPEHWTPAFYIDPIESFPFQSLEHKLLAYADDATDLLESLRSSSGSKRQHQ